MVPYCFGWKSTRPIAEGLIKSCVFDIAECLLDEKSVKGTTELPPFNDSATQNTNLAADKD